MVSTIPVAHKPNLVVYLYLRDQGFHFAAKREHLVALMNKPAKEPKPKLSPEERAAHRREALAKAREAKKTKKAQMEALMEKLAQSGKSIEELMAELGQ